LIVLGFRPDKVYSTHDVKTYYFEEDFDFGGFVQHFDFDHFCVNSRSRVIFNTEAINVTLMNKFYNNMDFLVKSTFDEASDNWDVTPKRTKRKLLSMAHLLKAFVKTSGTYAAAVSMLKFFLIIVVKHSSRYGVKYKRGKDGFKTYVFCDYG